MSRPGGAMCVVCGSKNKEGLMRQSGFKCGACIGKRSKSTLRKESKKRLDARREEIARKKDTAPPIPKQPQLPKPAAPQIPQPSLQEILNNKGPSFEPDILEVDMSKLPPPPPPPEQEVRRSSLALAPPTPHPKQVSVACSPIIVPSGAVFDTPMAHRIDTGVGASPVVLPFASSTPPSPVRNLSVGIEQIQQQEPLAVGPDRTPLHYARELPPRARRTSSKMSGKLVRHPVPIGDRDEWDDSPAPPRQPAFLKTAQRNMEGVRILPSRVMPQEREIRASPAPRADSRHIVPYPQGGRKEYIDSRAVELLATAGFNGRDMPATFDIGKLLEDFNINHELPELPFRNAQSVMTPDMKGEVGSPAPTPGPPIQPLQPEQSRDTFFDIEAFGNRFQNDFKGKPNMLFDSPAPPNEPLPPKDGLPLSSSPAPLGPAEPKPLHPMNSNIIDSSLMERRQAFKSAYELGHTGHPPPVVMSSSFRTTRGVSV